MFDKFDHHEYGLIQIRKGTYVRCTNPCCKPNWLVVDPIGDN